VRQADPIKTLSTKSPSSTIVYQFYANQPNPSTLSVVCLAANWYDYATWSAT